HPQGDPMACPCGTDEIPSPKVYMKQELVSLYLIAHKYHFESHESFARHLIGRHCVISPNGPHIARPHRPTSPNAPRAASNRLRIATLTEPAPAQKESFAYALQRMWIYRLKHTASPSRTRSSGRVAGLRNFVGELYYLELTRMKPVPVDNTGAYASRKRDLAPHQKLVCIRGTEAPKTGMGCTQLTHYCQHLREILAKSFDPWKELLNVAKEISTVAEQEELVADCAVTSINNLIPTENNIANIILILEEIIDRGTTG
ncbi:hypothetical protein BJ912DRAFT_978596, partial [Pholiota molesta]